MRCMDRKGERRTPACRDPRSDVLGVIVEAVAESGSGRSLDEMARLITRTSCVFLRPVLNVGPELVQSHLRELRLHVGAIESIEGEDQEDDHNVSLSEGRHSKAADRCPNPKLALRVGEEWRTDGVTRLRNAVPAGCFERLLIPSS